MATFQLACWTIRQIYYDVHPPNAGGKMLEDIGKNFVGTNEFSCAGMAGTWNCSKGVAPIPDTHEPLSISVVINLML